MWRRRFSFAGFLGIACTAPTMAIAQPMPVAVARAVDYPAEVPVTDQQWEAEVRFAIRPDGLVPECEILKSSGQRLLDVESCRILVMRARFAPPKNGQVTDAGIWQTIRFRWLGAESRGKRFEAGQPIGFSPLSWLNNVDYPAEAALRDEQGTVEYEVSVSKYGKPERCRVIGSSGSKILDARTCELVEERAIFIPSASPDGEPRAGTAYGEIRWKLG